MNEFAYQGGWPVEHQADDREKLPPHDDESIVTHHILTGIVNKLRAAPETDNGRHAVMEDPETGEMYEVAQYHKGAFVIDPTVIATINQLGPKGRIPNVTYLLKEAGSQFRTEATVLPAVQDAAPETPYKIPIRPCGHEEMVGILQKVDRLQPVETQG